MSFETERLVARGRLAELQQKARELKLSIRGDVDAVRMMLPPYAPIRELEAQKAAVQCVELAGKHAEYMGVLAEIMALEKALG
ncbi:MAG: hypothetical protein CSA34_00430 [Desulfobulbus propionicus]|nr:MAG: hypothetical protein CSA34_00430 [Desulfobulbus propionicus]